MIRDCRSGFDCKMVGSLLSPAWFFLATTWQFRSHRFLDLAGQSEIQFWFAKSRRKNSCSRPVLLVSFKSVRGRERIEHEKAKNYGLWLWKKCFGNPWSQFETIFELVSQNRAAQEICAYRSRGQLWKFNLVDGVKKQEAEMRCRI